MAGCKKQLIEKMVNKIVGPDICYIEVMIYIRKFTTVNALG